MIGNYSLRSGVPDLKKVYLLKLLSARALKKNCMDHLKQRQLWMEIEASPLMTQMMIWEPENPISELTLR